MSKPGLYWPLQFVGWGLVVALYVPIMVRIGKPFTLTNSVTVMSLCALSGVLLTHIWKSYLNSRGYLDLPLKRNLFLFAAGTLALGALLTFSSGVWYWLFLFPDTFRRSNWVPSALLFWMLLSVIWMTMYLAARSIRRTGELEKERLQTQILANDARLAMLRQQLNPHFLFNSLNSLRALIFEDAQKASQMVDRLAALLRYSLQSGTNELVTVEEEMLMVNEYLSIEKIRFEERLKVEVAISCEAKKALLPRMLLQTLVENAVKHGIERSIAGGTVEIDAEMKQGDLQMLVRNPGVLETGSTSTRLGLKNAGQRLALLKGPRADLQIRQAGQEIEVSVVVPQ